MKLIYASASPFVRKVTVVLEEAGLSDQVERVDGFGSPVAPNANAVAANPTGKIPSLKLNDGSVLYDSRVITRYLDQTYNLGLYPDNTNDPTANRQFRVLTLEAQADAILEAAVLCVYEVRCREEAERSDAWLSAQRGKIARALDSLESTWLDDLHGELSMAQIAVACALDYLDFRAEMGGWTNWRDAHPGLIAWHSVFSQRESMKATQPS